jgi:subtilisin family serine protease
MRWIRSVVVFGVAIVLVAAAGLPARAATTRSGTTEYVVLYAERASVADARDAIADAGGTIVREDLAIGMAKVHSSSATFMADARASSAIKGVTRNHSIGTSKPGMPHRYETERPDREAGYQPGNTSPPPGNGYGAVKEGKKKSGTEPLSPLQWDMKMLGATADGSYEVEQGDPRVLVGVIDTGIDGSHPDLAPNFNKSLSVNFTTDIPDVDGPCEYEGCVDPVDVDNNEHGTHVAGTIGAAINGFGISGVAPGVTLVNIRAGQDSGFFFLEETVNALTYAADHGVDVVNMSFYTDPWLYNCPDAKTQQDPAASDDEAAEQKAIYDAIVEATTYAHEHAVTMVAAAGNEAQSMDAAEKFDDTSPDYPLDAAYERTVTDDCLDLPTQAPFVLTVSALGPSTTKSDYSNYGTEVDVSAPGGWFRDGFGTKTFRTAENMILSAYPEALGHETGQITNGGGVPNNPFVVRDCSGDFCAYYQYLQGTSMASPHAAGVAALIVSAFGTSDGAGGLTMDPDDVAARLRSTATDHACPTPPTVDYTVVGRPVSWNATCTGTADENNFYGDGIVNALAAVS